VTAGAGDVLQGLEDRAEIVEAIAAYCRCADLNRPEDQVALFVEDCRVSYGGPGRWIEGRGALLEALRRALGAYTATSHLLGPSEIALDGDRAQASTAVHAWHRRADGAADVVLYGRYVDEWVRTGDGWRIAVREFRAAGATGRSEAALTPLGRRTPATTPA
jgi:hypothetical protein